MMDRIEKLQGVGEMIADNSKMNIILFKLWCKWRGGGETSLRKLRVMFIERNRIEC